MDDDKIVLDRKSFEALAVDTRVKILKSLKERRKTLSELAKDLGMSVSGIKEHLQILEKVGLIKKMDDGHKWKYYELTKKGNEIIGPKELRVWILLSISALALFLSIFAMLPTHPIAQVEPELMMYENLHAEDIENSGERMEAKIIDNRSPAEADTTSSAMTDTIQENPSADWHGKYASVSQNHDFAIPLLIAAVSAITMLACIIILIKNRRAIS